MRHRSPELRDVVVVHEPGACAARTPGQRRAVRQDGDDAAEEAGRGSRTAAPRSARCEADEALEGAGRLPWRADGRSVQGGSLPLLTDAGAEAPALQSSY